MVCSFYDVWFSKRGFWVLNYLVSVLLLARFPYSVISFFSLPFPQFFFDAHTMSFLFRLVFDHLKGLITLRDICSISSELLLSITFSTFVTFNSSSSKSLTFWTIRLQFCIPSYSTLFGSDYLIISLCKYGVCFKVQ